MTALLLSLLLSAQDFTITKELLDGVFKEARPLVEKATGVKFASEPTYAISTRAELRKILEAELAPQMAMQAPQLTDEARRELTGQSANLMSIIALGKYAPATRSVHIVPENFKDLAEMYEKPRLNSLEYLRVVAIHELVHAIDEQVYSSMANLKHAKSADDLVIWGAVIEGHAQHVTRAILVAEKREELFRDFEAQVSAVPPGASSEGEKYYAQAANAHLIFGYVDGRKFFDALAGLGRPSYVDDVFRKPPASRDVILQPASYYEPKALRVAEDHTPFFKTFHAEREGWGFAVQNLGRVEMRAGIGSFLDEKETAFVLAHLVGGQMSTLSDAREDRVLQVGVLGMTSEENAKTMYDLDLKISKAKDERMKEGMIRIVEAKYGELKTKSGVRHVFVRKKVSLGRRELSMCTGIGQVGTYVFETIYSNCEVTDEAAAADLDRIAAYLQGSKR